MLTIRPARSRVTLFFALVVTIFGTPLSSFAEPSCSTSESVLARSLCLPESGSQQLVDEFIALRTSGQVKKLLQRLSSMLGKLGVKHTLGSSSGGDPTLEIDASSTAHKLNRLVGSLKAGGLIREAGFDGKLLREKPNMAAALVA